MVSQIHWNLFDHIVTSNNASPSLLIPSLPPLYSLYYSTASIRQCGSTLYFDSAEWRVKFLLVALTRVPHYPSFIYTYSVHRFNS